MEAISSQFQLTTSLRDRTFELLKQRSSTIEAISTESGIDYSWLQMFSRGRIKDPSVNRIQTLYEYLTNTKLELR